MTTRGGREPVHPKANATRGLGVAEVLGEPWTAFTRGSKFLANSDK